MSKPTTIKIDDQEYIRVDQIKDRVVKERKGAWTVGEKYLIRTVTMIQTGRLIYIDDKELVLEDAAWIADTGRFSVALDTSNLSEVEPFKHDVIIGRGAIVDATLWPFDLPKAMK